MKTNPFLILALLLATFSNFLYGQSYKIIYEMKWKSVKNAPEYNNELCVLIVNNNQPSFFESYNSFKQDSLKTKIINDYVKNQSQGPLRIPTSDKKALYRPLIVKNIVDKKITIEETLYIKTFSITYDCPINWKVSTNETESTFGYKTQKATCEFGGRKWTAWFTTDIPIMEGPYKFYGLPGLILKISDSEDNYIFEIKGITKETNNIEYRNFDFSKSIKLSPKQWTSFQEKYKKYPSIILENMNTTQTTHVIGGKDINSREVKDAYNKKEWEAMKLFENPIEPSPTCH